MGAAHTVLEVRPEAFNCVDVRVPARLLFRRIDMARQPIVTVDLGVRGAHHRGPAVAPERSVHEQSPADHGSHGRRRAGYGGVCRGPRL
jgi:hypothetical protein